jgi:hypothetical protein
VLFLLRSEGLPGSGFSPLALQKFQSGASHSRTQIGKGGHGGSVFPYVQIATEFVI